MKIARCRRVRMIYAFGSLFHWPGLWASFIDPFAIWACQLPIEPARPGTLTQPSNQNCPA